MNFVTQVNKKISGCERREIECGLVGRLLEVDYFRRLTLSHPSATGLGALWRALSRTRGGGAACRGRVLCPAGSPGPPSSRSGPGAANRTPRSKTHRARFASIARTCTLEKDEICEPSRDPSRRMEVLRRRVSSSHLRESGTAGQAAGRRRAVRHDPAERNALGETGRTPA